MLTSHGTASVDQYDVPDQRTSGYEIEFPEVQMELRAGSPLRFESPGFWLAENPYVRIVSEFTESDADFSLEIVSKAIARSTSGDPHQRSTPTDECAEKVEDKLARLPASKVSIEEVFPESEGWRLNPKVRGASIWLDESIPRVRYAHFTQSVALHAAKDFIDDVNLQFLDDGPWKRNFELADMIARKFGAEFDSGTASERRILENYLRLAITHWTSFAISTANDPNYERAMHPKYFIPVLSRKDFRLLHGGLSLDAQNYLRSKATVIMREVDKEYLDIGGTADLGDHLAGVGLLEYPEARNNAQIREELGDEYGSSESADVSVFNYVLKEYGKSVRDLANNALYGKYGADLQPLPHLDSTQALDVHTVFHESNSKPWQQFYELRTHTSGLNAVEQIVHRAKSIDCLAAKVEISGMTSPIVLAATLTSQRLPTGSARIGDTRQQSGPPGNLRRPYIGGTVSQGRCILG